MQSLLFLFYILFPLTFGLKNFQNSMIGMFNSGVPKVPNSYNIYELFNNGKKKIRPVVYQKINEDEPTPEPSVEIQDSLNRDLQESNNDLRIRRYNSPNTEHPKLPMYFPIPGGQGGDYNPYPTLLRLGLIGKGGGINFESLPSSESYGQYFPVPPFTQARGGKDVAIVQPREYSFPKEKSVWEKYNGEMGGNNGYIKGINGESNGDRGEDNDYNHDMDLFNKIIEDLTPRMKPHLSLVLDQEEQELLDNYKRITNTLNGKGVEKDLLGSIAGSNGFKAVPVGYNGGSNGLKAVSGGYNGGSNGMKAVSGGYNGGSNGVNGGHNGFEGTNGAKKAVRQEYNNKYTGMKVKNNGGLNNAEKIDYNQEALAYTKRQKAFPLPEKSWAWTSKSINFSPDQQAVLEKYKRALDLFNGKIVSKTKQYI